MGAVDVFVLFEISQTGRNPVQGKVCLSVSEMYSSCRVSPLEKQVLSHSCLPVHN